MERMQDRFHRGEMEQEDVDGTMTANQLIVYQQ